MNSIVARLRKLSQTRTEVHSAASEQSTQVLGLRRAYRMLAAVQVLAQLLLWTVHWLYFDLEYASWQPILLMLVPALSLFFLWGALPVHPASLATRRLRLFLLPCLWLDAGLLFVSLSLLCQLQLSMWPVYAIVVGIAAFTYFTLVLSGRHGVAFGVNLLWWIIPLLVLGTFTFSGEPIWDNLWPILGDGIPQTLQASLLGVGSVWSIALFFVLPRDASVGKLRESKGRLSLYAILPIAIVLLWMFYHAMRGPWLAMNRLEPKESMRILIWSGTNLFTFLFTTVLWFVLLPVSLSSNSACATSLILEAFPRAPKKLVVILYLLPPMLFALLPPTQTLKILQLILPYRFVLSMLVAVGLLILERRQRT